MSSGVGFPVPDSWRRDTAESSRDEQKRKESPGFFFSQGRALVLAAEYFHDGRLSDQANIGSAVKHRHKIHLAFFGQLMASFEYLLKDFVAKVIDVTDICDEAIRKTRWIDIDASRILASRTVATTPGSILIHPTTGWHTSDTINKRYSELFERQPINTSEQRNLERL